MITKLKKKPEEYLKCREEFFNTIKEKNLSMNLATYFFDTIVAMSRGYSFCLGHTLAYSIVALQEMNLAYKYPIIFWNTANLIVDSGSMNLEEEFEENEDSEDEEEKIKNSSCDYGKMASAIGKMKNTGISFSLPNINLSDITFSPDLEKNRILYGLRGITRIGNQLIKDIIKNRPYSSIEDFLSKIKINKVQMINLIKSGIFDELYQKPRKEIMNDYINLIADKKKRITLQNMNMLINKDLIPEELDYEKRVFNFNKYLKNFKVGSKYQIDEIAMNFYNQHYDMDLLTDIEYSGDIITAYIDQMTWDKIYKKEMDPVRDWMKKNQEEILATLNNTLYEEAAEKYCDGSISKWEMDALSFYYHEHELANLRNDIYGIDDFEKMSEEPNIIRAIETKDGKSIPIYEIKRIAGTVIDKDKNKGTVSLLTTTGVVVVKVWKNQFAVWDRQLSQKNPDGTKTIIEKSWFTRGNKLIITGVRKESAFIPKKYKNTEYPLFEKILEMDDKGFIISSQTERAEVDE